MLAMKEIIERLQALVPELGKVEGAIELAALMASKPQAHAKPRAHVVPMGLKGGALDNGTGDFTQAIDVAFTVFLTFSAVADPRGQKAAVDVHALQTSVLEALCGWGPEDAVGVVRLLRAAPIDLRPGALVYAIEFAIQDQLRIAL
ncbi:MAG: phage tail terminator protein [Cypionkella sp.]